MQTRRRLLQAFFLLLTLAGVFVVGGNAERWCPFGGVEALYAYFYEGDLLCSLGVSNLYILAAVLLSVLLLRRAFCAYVCPLGTVGEWIQKAAARLGIRARRVPTGLDRALGMAKYLVLAVVLYFTVQVGELVFRGYDPCYALLSRHGEDITTWAYVIAGGLVLASAFVLIPLCRWLCPLAAVFAPLSRIGLGRVRRVAPACIDCGACGRVCPMAIPVEHVADVTAARCTACLECLSACPKRSEGALEWGPPRRLGGRWSQGVLLVVLVLCLGAAVGAVYAFPLPSFVRSWGEPAGRTQVLRLKIHGVGCRDKAKRLTEFVARQDDLEIPGYVKLEAWPGTEPAAVHITYEPGRTTPAAIEKAITSLYLDAGGAWRVSPFSVAPAD